MTDRDALDGMFPATSMPDADWWAVLWPQPGIVVTKLGLSHGMTAVDLCCGDGLFARPLVSIADKVTAIDLDPAMEAPLTRRLAGMRKAKWSFVAGDAYRVQDYVDAPVDFVLIANTFHGVPDQGRLSASVFAALKQGGLFAIVNWHRRPREETTVLGVPRGPKTELRMTPEMVASALLPSGLRLLRVVELPPYHYAAVFIKP